jgi:hypothetical protein
MSSIFIFKGISYSTETDCGFRGGILLHFSFRRSGEDVRESETDSPTRETRALPWQEFRASEI